MLNILIYTLRRVRVHTNAQVWISLLHYSLVFLGKKKTCIFIYILSFGVLNSKMYASTNMNTFVQRSISGFDKYWLFVSSDYILYIYQCLVRVRRSRVHAYVYLSRWVNVPSFSLPLIRFLSLLSYFFLFVLSFCLFSFFLPPHLLFSCLSFTLLSCLLCILSFFFSPLICRFLFIYLFIFPCFLFFFSFSSLAFYLSFLFTFSFLLLSPLFL